MGNLKYFVGVLIVGVFLIMSLSLNVSAIPYISIGNITHNFTVVPGQPAEITLPIIVKNASDAPIKGLQFNVTYNCSVINITNITHVEIVDVPNVTLMNRTYNVLCNGTPMPLGLRNVFCFFRNTTPVSVGGVNRTNASILIATVRNTTPDMCVLRIAFASYKNLTTDAVIGRVNIKVNPMPTNFTLPMNITVERMGLNRTVYVDVSNATIHSQVKTDGLIKVCRGDANGNGIVGEGDIGDIVLLSRYAMGPESARFYDLTNISECLDVNGNGIVGERDIGDIVLLSRYAMGPESARFYNLTDIKF